MTALDEPSTKFAEIIDFSVADEDDCLVLVRHRLRAGDRQVDNRESAVAEISPSVIPRAFTIGTAMSLRLIHLAHDATGRVGRESLGQKSADCTHGETSAGASRQLAGRLRMKGPSGQQS